VEQPIELIDVCRLSKPKLGHWLRNALNAYAGGNPAQPHSSQDR